MHPIEILVYGFVLIGLALGIGILLVVIPAHVRKREPKKYGFTEPAALNVKDTVHARDLDDDEKNTSVASFNV